VPTVADAAPPGALRTVLLPVAVAYTVVQVACAAAVLISPSGRRRRRPEVPS
jgi:hypothetical protein